MKRLLFLYISDWWITGVFAVGWLIFWGLALVDAGSLEVFWQGISSNFLVIGLFYIWLKAVLVDGWRIIKKEKLMMPVYVFWVYGLSYAVFWMMSDLIYNNIGRRLSESFTPAEQFFYYDNPWLFWLLLDLISSALILVWPVMRWLSQEKDLQSRLILDLMKTVLLMVIFVFVDQFISL